MSYEQRVLDHYARPFQRGLRMTKGELGVPVEARSQVCGDWIFIDAALQDGKLDLWWTGEGCCFSQAAASMLAEHFTGRTMDDVRAFTEEDMFQLFSAPCPDARKSCVLVSFHALKKLEELYP